MATPPPDGGGVAASHPPVRAAGWKKKEGERLRSWSADGIVYIGVGASAWLLEQLSLLSAFPFRAVALALAGAGIVCLFRHRRCLWALTWRTVEQGALLSGLLCFGLGGLLCSLGAGAGWGLALGLLSLALLLCHACLSAWMEQQWRGGLVYVVQLWLAAYWAVSISLLFE